jgi:hypothetical protein
MIGGHDIVIPAAGAPSSLEACVRAIRQHWPHARFENAETAEKYADEIPFVRVNQLFAYSDERAEALWDQDSPDSPMNSMLYLIRSPDSITVVVDDPDVGDAPNILKSIRVSLGSSLRNGAGIQVGLTPRELGSK